MKLGSDTFIVILKPNLKLKACSWVGNSNVQQGKSVKQYIRVSECLTELLLKQSSVVFQIGPGERQPFELTVKRLESALQKAREQVFSLDQINCG